MPENTGKLQQNDSASNPEQSTFPRDAVGLTKQQRALLVFIGDYHRRFGVSPSFQEMMEHMGLRSKNGIHRLVHGLAKRGHVRLDKRAARSVVPKSVGPSLADAIDTLLSQAKLSSSTEAELRALLSAEVANG